jgi:folate-binding protein YgfZ
MLFDLSERAKFRFTGSDRVRYLNGQLSNDLAIAKPGDVIYAFALTAKGKLCGDLFVTVRTDEIFVDADSGLREALAARLERYIIADDVTLEDVTDDWALFHWMGPARPDLEQASLAIRFRAPGWDIWAPASDRPRLLADQPRASAESLEQVRIQSGMPRWGAELTEDTLPQEVGLDDLAISFTKGCYLGQEVVSRIHSIGHVNRSLCGLRAGSEIELHPGDQLIAEDTKTVGTITSVAPAQWQGTRPCLGYLRRGYTDPGTVLQVRRAGFSGLIGAVEVRSLPFQ